MGQLNDLDRFNYEPIKEKSFEQIVADKVYKILFEKGDKQETDVDTVYNIVDKIIDHLEEEYDEEVRQSISPNFWFDIVMALRTKGVIVND